MVAGGFSAATKAPMQVAPVACALYEGLQLFEAVEKSYLPTTTGDFYFEGEPSPLPVSTH